MDDLSDQQLAGATRRHNPLISALEARTDSPRVYVRVMTNAQHYSVSSLFELGTVPFASAMAYAETEQHRLCRYSWAMNAAAITAQPPRRATPWARAISMRTSFDAACCSTTVGPRRSRHPHAQVFRAWSPPRAVSGVKIMTDNPCPGLPKRCGAPYVGMPSLRSPRAQAVELMAHAQHCTELTAQMLPDVQATCVLRGCDGTTPGQALFPVLGALGPSRNSLRLGEAD
ncbi:hypothetical protein L226DRAFT_392267 [Lentinus tigrinus ALCF2SS1-7]|uniref:uncharacterized protein n=1 Tax=Lentinus tigrinus ALCF2SS1-7 TaxID=1328758 RepID=UPI0011663A0D|nr:hypothetical protein L226DRAFT_392267 [Lentinus tigrinus ALCF2SS1-7]